MKKFVPEELKEITFKCPKCTKSFDLKDMNLRPYMIKCGHTYCKTCANSFGQSYNSYLCTVCHAAPGNFKPAVNHMLETVMQSITKLQTQTFREPPNKVEAMKHAFVCLDCKCCFHRNPDDILGSFHASHETVLLDNFGLAKTNEIIWLIDLVSRGLGNMVRFQKILGAILEIGWQYQQALQKFSRSCEDLSAFEAATMSGLKGYIHELTGEQDPHKDLREAALKMRSLQMLLKSSVFKLAGHGSKSDSASDPFTTPEMQPLGDQDIDRFLVSLTKDEALGLHILPGRQHLVFLSDLRHEVVCLSDPFRIAPLEMTEAANSAADFLGKRDRPESTLPLDLEMDLPFPKPTQAENSQTTPGVDPSTEWLDISD